MIILLAVVLASAAMHAGEPAGVPPGEEPSGTGSGGERVSPEEAEKRAEKIRRMIRMLNSPSEFLRADAERFLVKVGEEAVPYLEAEVKKARERILPLVAVLEKIRKPKQAESARETEEEVRERTEKHYREKFETAKSHLDSGHPRLACALVDAIMLLEPHLSFRRELQTFRIRCQEQIVRAEMLACSLEPDSLVVAQGDVIKMKLVVKNVSNGSITVHPPKENPSFGVLRRHVTELLYDGKMHMYAKTIKPTLTESFTLQKGQRWVKEICIDTKVFARGPGVHVVLEMSGTLRPGTIDSGEESFSRYLPVPSVVLRIVPGDYAGLAGKPEEALDKAVEEAIAIKRDPGGKHAEDIYERLFHSALFAADVNPDRTIGALMRALNRVDRVGVRVVTAALRQITGRDFTGNVQDWIDWWYAKELGGEKK
jgi:hypothetical protein